MADLTFVIERAMRNGATLDFVEEKIIDPAPLEPDLKAALWLFAWSQLTRRKQRHEVSAMLALIGSPAVPAVVDDADERLGESALASPEGPGEVHE